MGAYEDGYQAGSVYGAIGACLADASQQPIYDLGFADAQSGRPMYSSYNPAASWQQPTVPTYDPNPPPTMDVPSPGTSWPPEPPEWPDYDLPPDKYIPEPEPDIVD